MQVINDVTAADVVFLAWVGYLFSPILLSFEDGDDEYEIICGWQ